MFISRGSARYAALFLLSAVIVAGCSAGGHGSIPSNSSPVSKRSGNGFNIKPGNSVPRIPQIVSTNAPYTLKFYSIPGCSTCHPHGITVGPDRLYFVEIDGNKVNSISYQGTFGTAVSTDSQPNEIAEGINGGMYIATDGTSSLAELEQDSFGGSIYGSWNDFGVASGKGGTNQVVSDPSGVLWFVEPANSSVVRMTTYGSILSRTALTAGSDPTHLAIGADNASVYAAENGTSKIAKFDLSGNLLSETPVTSGHSPTYITAGTDGNMYFTEYLGTSCTGGGYLGKLTSSGTLTMMSTNDCADLGITSGSDGNIWFAEQKNYELGELNVATQTISYHGLGSGEDPYGIVSGADGQLWFTTQGSGKIGSFQP